MAYRMNEYWLTWQLSPQSSWALQIKAPGEIKTFLVKELAGQPWFKCRWRSLSSSPIARSTS